jgi:hypothetical protein
MIDIVIHVFSLMINTRARNTMDNNKNEEQIEQVSVLEQIKITGTAEIIIPEPKEDDESEE